MGDLLFGTAGANSIDGLAGNDTLAGGLGDDLLIGGDGADELRGNQFYSRDVLISALTVLGTCGHMRKPIRALPG